MFVSLVISVTLLFSFGHASLPLIINTWPFKNAAIAGKTRDARHKMLFQILTADVLCALVEGNWTVGCSSRRFASHT